MNRIAIAAFFSLCVLMSPAHAGRSCEQTTLKAQTLEKGLALAVHTQQALDASGAQVVALARMGQDLSKYGGRYSHFGWVYKQDGRWIVAHKLNQCGTANAQLYRQGLGQFFLDDMFAYEAGMVIPGADVQARLLPLLKDNARLMQLHTESYNMLAYPWSQKYQQSNQWALETLALAMEPGATDRERAQSWLKFKGYEPVTLKLGPMTRLGARMTRANVAFDDHPNEKRFSDRIETVTVESVFEWMQNAGLAGALTVVR
jgi:hypothetical protein